MVDDHSHGLPASLHQPAVRLLRNEGVVKVCDPKEEMASPSLNVPCVSCGWCISSTFSLFVIDRSASWTWITITTAGRLRLPLVRVPTQTGLAAHTRTYRLLDWIGKNAGTYSRMLSCPPSVSGFPPLFAGLAGGLTDTRLSGWVEEYRFKASSSFRI